MKNSFLLIAAALITLSACKSKPDKKSITGKWKPVVIDVPDATEEENQEIIDSALIEFRNDSQFVSIKGKRDSVIGKYAYNEKDSSLTIHGPPDTESAFQFYKVKWSGDTLVLTHVSGEMKLLRK